jgi:membrane-associated protease RseP (regulator of RpoE activity)
MRLSVITWRGVFAILVCLSQSIVAVAQDEQGSGDRRHDAHQASENVQLRAIALTRSQDQSVRPDQVTKVDRGGGDQQVRAEALDIPGVLLQRPDQVNLTLMQAVADWRARENGNPPLQNDTYWSWTKGQDAPIWLGNFQDRFSGMSLVPADDALRSHLKLPKGEGLLVTALDLHSPAAEAGLQQNDVLLKLGDSPLQTTSHLEAALKAAGDKPVVLQIYRDGSARKIQVLPRIHVTIGPVAVQPPSSQFWIGVSVAAVEPALRAQLRLPANNGLLVNEVFKDSPAEKAGVKVNDILLSLDGKPLSEQKTLVELVQANGEKTITLELLHEGKPRGDVEITPERRKLTQNSDPNKLLQAFRWDVVRPGVMLNQTSPLQFQFRDVMPLTGLESKSKDQQHTEANVALSKRLDDLDAEIKKLRKALEELGGAAKSTADLNRAIEFLKKLSAEKK